MKVENTMIPTVESNEYATNWHNYDAADRCVEICESLERELNDLMPKLERTIVRKHVELLAARLKQVKDDMWYLRRCCDQNAG